MSATNWDTCPQCLLQARLDREERRAALQDSYGKIPQSEFLAALKEFEKEPKSPDETLREDYEVGITEAGEFFVIYRASCEQCDFSHTFKHEEKLTIQGATP